MNKEDIYDGITDIRDDLVEDAAKKKHSRSRRRLWMGAVAAVLALAILTGVVLLPGGNGLGTYAIALAEYPDMAPYPDESAYTDPKTGDFDDEGFNEAWTAWWTDARARRSQPDGYDRGYDRFVEKSARQFLSGAGDENRVCSPLSLYLALAMLAELSGGDSRQQILDVLESPDMDTLRTQTNSLWNANYIDDGATASLPASSLWLSEDIRFKREAMDILAENYYASSYTGHMGDPAFTAALRDWLNEQTGGLLQEQAENIELDTNTVLALATTLYFNARWGSEFNADKNTTDVFHAPTGDVTAEYMHKGGSRAYCWGEMFSAVSLPFAEGGMMSFILPDEGVSLDELLAQAELYAYLESSSGSWEKSKYLIVNMAVPKFDVSSELDLIAGLQELGVTAVFDAAAADFSPMTDDTGAYVSQVKHAARVMIDEEGCTAAAFTVIQAPGSSEPPDETVDFLLDRPFLFAITGGAGQILFLGVVNQPA
ncbi:MAG: serpin family protein [Oscillospiraceae bacterium]